MATSLEYVTGIGPATTAILRTAGIKTAEKLAETKLIDLIKVQGFSRFRAKKVIDAARSLVSGAESESMPDKGKKSGNRLKKEKKIKKQNNKKKDKDKKRKKKNKGKNKKK